MKTVEFSVQGMTCFGCAQGVQRAVSRHKGVQEAIASNIDKNVIVKYDETLVKDEDITHLIGRLGYQATPVK
ncbi:MAG: heavy metal-associated domain-containing protein [Acholeplasmataceae bacterium]|nr:cation transporter [Acholeplasmataceae bacterium]